MTRTGSSRFEMCAAKTVFVVLSIIVLYIQISESIQVQNYIINGQATGHFPHHVYIAYQNAQQAGFYGGGSIISPTHVLTVAQNVINFVSWNVGFGSNQFAQLTWIRTEHAVIHPNYNPDSRENDIALVVVGTPFVWSVNVQPISLPPSDRNLPLVNEQGIIIGFGWTSSTSQAQANDLKSAFVRVIPDGNCLNIIAVTFPNHFCAADDFVPANFCQGDIGGSFVTYYRNEMVLVGMNSILLEGCATNWPSAYTRIGPFRSWIAAETGV